MLSDKNLSRDSSQRDPGPQVTNQLAKESPGTSNPSADRRVVGATAQTVPAGVDIEHQDSDRSICESEVSIISNRSNSGKPRVAKVSKRPKQEYIADPQQRLAAMDTDAFIKDMEQRRIAAFSKTRTTSQAPLKDTEET